MRIVDSWDRNLPKNREVPDVPQLLDGSKTPTQYWHDYCTMRETHPEFARDHASGIAEICDTQIAIWDALKQNIAEVQAIDRALHAMTAADWAEADSVWHPH